MHDKTVKMISEFARNVRLGGKRTMRQLYDETGYEACHNEITQQDIEAAVSRDLTLIDEWMSFSEGKRWIPTWLLNKNQKSENRWVVLYEGKGDNSHNYQIQFSTPITACAFMIRMEMEQFRLQTKLPPKLAA
jgi:hypothetical protein